MKKKDELRQVHITDWAIVTLPDIYGALDNPKPAFAKLDGDRPVVLYGRVSKDPRFNPETGEFADGNRVITGVVQVIKDGNVHTSSTAYTENTAYTLGEMSDLYRRWCEEDKATPEIKQDTILRHICENCGKEVLLTSEDAWEQGWDYPPKMGTFKVVSPRTCGDCGIETSLWWEMICSKYQLNSSMPDISGHWNGYWESRKAFCQTMIKIKGIKYANVYSK